MIPVQSGLFSQILHVVGIQNVPRFMRYGENHYRSNNLLTIKDKLVCTLSIPLAHCTHTVTSTVFLGNKYMKNIKAFFKIELEKFKHPIKPLIKTQMT